MSKLSPGSKSRRCGRSGAMKPASDQTGKFVLIIIIIVVIIIISLIIITFKILELEMQWQGWLRLFQPIQSLSRIGVGLDTPGGHHYHDNDDDDDDDDDHNNDEWGQESDRPKDRGGKDHYNAGDDNDNDDQQ